MDDYISPDWGRAALLTIDVQRDFTAPDGPLPIAGTNEAARAMSRLCEAFRKKGLPIVHIVRLYLPDGSNVDLCRRASIESGNRLVAPGTPGSQLVEDLLPSADVLLAPDLLLKGEPQRIGPREWIVYKPRFGSFYQTPLEELLRSEGVNTVVVAGCNFPNCPRTTIYEATERDFRVAVIEDAVSGIYDKGVEELKNIGVTMLLAEQVVSTLANE